MGYSVIATEWRALRGGVVSDIDGTQASDDEAEANGDGATEVGEPSLAIICVA